MRLITMLTTCLVVAHHAGAAGLQQAKVTNIQKQVWIVPPGKSPQTASVGSMVSGSTAVRTGVKSLAEITFADKTLLRLGSNTQFSFQSGLREVNLRSGTALFQVPKGSGGLRVRTGSITAAITGSEAKVKAPDPGKPGSFLLLNLHGTMAAEFEDASFKDGDVPKPLPRPRGLSKLFNGNQPFSVQLGAGEGFYAWVDESGQIIGDSVNKFIFDLNANINSGRLTEELGVTSGTLEAAVVQNQQKKELSLIAVSSLKPLPGSFQAIPGTVFTQQTAQVARRASMPSNPPAPGATLVQVVAVPNPERPTAPPIIVVTPVPPPNPTTPPDVPMFDPDKLPFCMEMPGELPYPENGMNSNCRWPDFPDGPDSPGLDFDGPTGPQ